MKELNFNGAEVSRIQWRETICRDCPRRIYILSEVEIAADLTLVWRETLPPSVLCEVCYGQKDGLHHRPADPPDVAGKTAGEILAYFGSAGDGQGSIPAAQACGE